MQDSCQDYIILSIQYKVVDFIPVCSGAFLGKPKDQSFPPPALKIKVIPNQIDSPGI